MSIELSTGQWSTKQLVSSLFFCIEVQIFIHIVNTGASVLCVGLTNYLQLSLYPTETPHKVVAGLSRMSHLAQYISLDYWRLDR